MEKNTTKHKLTISLDHRCFAMLEQMAKERGVSKSRIIEYFIQAARM